MMMIVMWWKRTRPDVWSRGTSLGCVIVCMCGYMGAVCACAGWEWEGVCTQTWHLNAKSHYSQNKLIPNTFENLLPKVCGIHYPQEYSFCKIQDIYSLVKTVPHLFNWWFLQQLKSVYLNKLNIAISVLYKQLQNFQISKKSDQTSSSKTYKSKYSNRAGISIVQLSCNYLYTLPSLYCLWLCCCRPIIIVTMQLKENQFHR